MKQAIISAVALICVALSSSVVLAEETVRTTDRFYDENGKLLCESAGKEYGKCHSYNYFLLVHRRSVYTSGLAKYNELADKFAKEAARQIKLHQAMTAQQYYEKPKALRSKSSDCVNDFGVIGCKLSAIEKEILPFVVPDYDGRRNHFWGYKGGVYLRTEIHTPLQEERFGPYDQQTQSRLQGLVDEFNVECLDQQMREKSRPSANLLRIVLRASSVMVGSLTPKKRQSLFAEWYKKCGKLDENPEDTTTRFLLSRKVRGGKIFFSRRHRLVHGSSKDAWGCRVLSDPLRSIDDCGTLTFWYSEERKMDLTPKLRKVVPTLKEAKQK